MYSSSSALRAESVLARTWKPTAKTTVSGLHFFSDLEVESVVFLLQHCARGFSMVKLLPCAQVRSRFNVARKLVTSFHPTPRPTSKYLGTSFIPPHLKGISTPPVRWYSDFHSQDTRGGHPIDPTKSDKLHDHATSSAHSQQNSRSLYTGRSGVFPISNSSFADALLTSIVGLGIGEWNPLT